MVFFFAIFRSLFIRNCFLTRKKLYYCWWQTNGEWWLNGDFKGGFVMEKMLTVSELSKITEIPESTVRRYLTRFEAYFPFDSRGKGKKYRPDSIEVLKQIAVLYSEGYQANEIEPMLANRFPFTINDSMDTTTQPQHKSIELQFEEFKEQQDEFNKQLLEKLEHQQNFIKKLLEDQNQSFLQNTQEIQLKEKENINQQAKSPEQKAWWKFWK